MPIQCPSVGLFGASPIGTVGLIGVGLVVAVCAVGATVECRLVIAAVVGGFRLSRVEASRTQSLGARPILRSNPRNPLGLGCGLPSAKLVVGLN